MPAAIERAVELPSRVARRTRRRIRRPRVTIDRRVDVLRLGSSYGGWSLVDEPTLRGATIFSAGLGEDASFDIEFVNRYDANVVCIDPTPRAVEHFRQIAARGGIGATDPFVDGGRQPVTAYDLTTVTVTNFVLVDKALWPETGPVRFYEPPDPNHVSHSIVDVQHDHRCEGSYIEVETISLDELVVHFGEPSLLKLDIEGAEIEVLDAMFAGELRPRQILVEFDELLDSRPRGCERVRQSLQLFEEHGYLCHDFDGLSNFLFART